MVVILKILQETVQLLQGDQKTTSNQDSQR